MMKGSDDTDGSDALHEMARLAHAKTVVPWTPSLRARAEVATWLPAYLGRDGTAAVRVKRLGRARHDVDTVLVHVEGEADPRYIARTRIVDPNPDEEG